MNRLHVSDIIEFVSYKKRPSEGSSIKALLRRKVESFNPFIVVHESNQFLFIDPNRCMLLDSDYDLLNYCPRMDMCYSSKGMIDLSEYEIKITELEDNEKNKLFIEEAKSEIERLKNMENRKD